MEGVTCNASALCLLGKEGTTTQEEEQRRSAAGTPHTGTATRRSSRYQEIHIGESAIGDTPQTAIKRRRLYSNPPADNLSSNELEVRSRRFDCTGIPVKCVNPALMDDDDADPQEHCRHLCAVCGKATPWFCVGCHEYVCADFKDSKRDSGYYIARLGGEENKTVVCKKTCCITFHLEALEKAAED